MQFTYVDDHANEPVVNDPYQMEGVTVKSPLGFARKPSTIIASLFGVALAMLGAALTFWQAALDHRDRESAPFAYFEVRVIDEDGRPIAGAEVKEGESSLGVTDAFGEWRRFMRRTSGSEMKINILKRTHANSFAAEKTLKIPEASPDGGDVDVTATVVLKGGRSGALRNVAGVSGAQAMRPSLWFEVEPGSPEATFEVMAQLRKRSRELGMPIEQAAAKKITLSHVGATSGKSRPFVKAKVGGTVVSRVYQPTSAQTAEAILVGLGLSSGHGSEERARLSRR